MKLSEASLLVLSDHPKTIEAVQLALAPLIKRILYAKNTTEAVAKATNSPQDLILLGTAKAHLPQRDNFWTWCQSQRSYRQVPWIFLGGDQEPLDQVKDLAHVKICSLDNLEGLIRAVESSLQISSHSLSSGAHLLNRLIGSVLDVLQSRGLVECSREQPFVRHGPQDGRPTDASLYFDLEVGGKNTSLMACLSEPVLRTVCKNALKLEILEPPHFKKGAHELAQLILDQTTLDLSDLGLAPKPDTLSVEFNRGHLPQHKVPGPYICIPFGTREGALHIECVAPTQSS